VAALLNKARQPNNLSAVSIAAAVAAVNEPDVVHTRREQNTLWRNELATMFEQSFDFDVHDSETNFILARIPSAWKRHARSLCDDLSAEGIVIRAMDAYGLEDCVRVTTAPPSHIARLQRSLRKIAGTCG
jgi:histidinol-phosphate aminotransferase